MKNVNVIVFLVILVSGGLAYGFAGGDGSPENPYQIATKADLEAVNVYLSASYILLNDIDLAGTTYTRAVIAKNTGDTRAYEGEKFSGSFDGNGHVVRNLTINGGGYCHMGLFGRIGFSTNASDGRIACVKNLGVEDVNITNANEYAGGLAGWTGEGADTFGCYATGSVSGNKYLGGLVGENFRSRMDDCYAEVVVVSTLTTSEPDYIGGLVGYNSYSTLTNSYATGSVTGSRRTGGLVGLNDWGVVVGCHATGNVFPTNGFNAKSIGGLAGESSVAASISNCYATGNVSGWERVGGLVGYTYQNVISDSYSTGNVTIAGADAAHGIGGLVGYHINTTTIQNCYSTGSVTGDANTYNVGGLVGEIVYNSLTNVPLVYDSYATGSVSAGGINVGGFVGLSGGYIERCYSTGLVTGIAASTGGFAGASTYPGYVADSFWDVNTSGMTASPGGGTSKTTAEMQTVSTYTGANWDIYPAGTEDDWYVVDGNYPEVYRLSSVYTVPFDGSGTADDPYHVSTPAHLKEIVHHSSSHFVLDNDIDLTGISDTAAFIGPNLQTYVNARYIGQAFCGTFDGNDFAIQNLTIESDNHFMGLFGQITGGVVKNLGVENVSIGTFAAPMFHYNRRTGGLAGSIITPMSSVVNCYVTGEIRGQSYLGGFVGENTTGGKISDCYADTDIIGGYWSGGFVGHATTCARISNCHATGSVTGVWTSTHASRMGGFVGNLASSSVVDDCYATGDVSGGVYLGGFAGSCVEGSSISNSYATGSVTADHHTQQHIGGFVGHSELDSPVIDNCYSTGNAVGKYRVGGFIGNNSTCMISNCYSTGSAHAIAGDGNPDGRVGGFVGQNWSYTTYENNYSTGSATAATTGAIVGGFIGDANNPDIVMSGCFWDVTTSGEPNGLGSLDDSLYDITGLTTAQMKTRSNFVNASWDYATIWAQCADNYPILRWQGIYSLLADLDGDCIVNMLDLKLLAENWLQTGQSLIGDIDDDAIVNFEDYATLAEEWSNE